MAVINRTECSGKSIRSGKMLQGSIVLVLVLIGGGSANPQGCDQARKDIVAAGFPASSVLDRPVGGEICGENSCCTKESEQKTLLQTKHQIDTFLRDSISKLSSLIDTRAKKFDGLFREMMNNSRLEFHEMFQKTYGKIYLQNSDVFSDFFQELETYYKKGSIRLTDTLESFFGVLYQRMFKVINGQYTFDDKYLECVADHMAEVMPFGDLPNKFTMQLRRSFVATRTYYKALSTAAEAAKKIVNVRIDKDCDRELVNMQLCGSCKGLRGVGTCSNYCAAVLEACLRHHTAFSAEWDNFIEALDKVADRLVGPYSIESVVDPLNIKISEAIMNFQETGTEVSRKIYKVCGTPSLSRRKRKAPATDNIEDNPSFEIKKYETMKMHGHKKKKTKKYEEEDNVPSLERLIREIKAKVRETRQFWAHLPYQYCNNITAAPSDNGNCWNGTTIGEYNKTSRKSTAPISPLVSEQIYALQLFTDKLRKAFQGEEVEIVDDSEDTMDGSGSGSGDFDIVESEQEETKAETDGNTPSDKNGIDIVIVPEAPASPPSTTGPEVKKTLTGGASTMSLSKALAQYLLPIVLVWFGGAISDLL